MPKAYTNQKLLRFVPVPKDAFHPYTLWNDDALEEALSDLSVTAFKVYIYLGMRKDMKERFALSRAHIVKTLSISEGSYHKAIKELQEKRYIVPDPSAIDDDNCYIFFEAKAPF
ncbi:MAG: hypothetical protein ACI4IW_08130 [Oscillospiraceae bacterium]